MGLQNVFFGQFREAKALRARPKLPLKPHPNASKRQHMFMAHRAQVHPKD